MAARLEQEKLEVRPGGSFLLDRVGSNRIQAPESFTEEQRLYYKTAFEFARQSIEPVAARIEKKDYPLLRELLLKAGELGLCAVDIPEAYGGLSLDLTTSGLIAEAMTCLGSWTVSHGGHVGIGTLPIVYFGTEEQKQKYLPKLGTAELVAAYALTETFSGSDALGARTRATLTPDGKHYLLNGTKQFITNAAFADVFIVFAKVGGDKFSAFIVEKGTPGFTVGAEEHKMGIRGSSTCALIFEDARVPVENLLGEIGKGHKIAFNILNIGRLKLGIGVVGAARLVIKDALGYARDRKQFATPIIEFPLMREKLARMAAVVHVNESMAYRTCGLIDAALGAVARDSSEYQKQKIQVIEEYALESSIMKVFGSEALQMVVDEAVQIHGGYGFIEEFAVERAYRDARINRIFEGTNEINRMLVTGMLLKRSMKGQLPFMEFAAAVDEELQRGEGVGLEGTDELAHEARAGEMVKRMVAVACKVAVETFGVELEKHQQVLSDIADVTAEAFAIDSVVARTRQAASGGKLDPVRVALVQLYVREAHSRALDRARRAICAAKKDHAAPELAKLDRLFTFRPYDPEALRETVVEAMIERGGYPFSIV